MKKRERQHNGSDTTNVSSSSQISIEHKVKPQAGAITAANAENFWSKVARGAPEECWLWTGHIGIYGQFRCMVGNESRIRGAHQVAYFLTHGAIPEGLEVLHSCDNPICCNPAHLSRGTRSENLLDASRKKRFRPRERKALTAELALAIKRDLAAGLSGRTVAAKYNTIPQNVSDIKCGKSWAWVCV